MARENKKSGAAPAPGGLRWGLFAGIVGMSVLSVSAGMGALRVREYAVHDPQFRISRDRPDAVAIEGLRYASRSKVLRIFASDFDNSIFSVPLAERRRRRRTAARDS